MKKDGIDHINIYSKGKTELGRKLTNFADIEFTHPEFGYFRTIEGFWYWLGCRNNDLRLVDGPTAKRVGRELGAADWLPEGKFRDYIKEALVLRFKQHPELEQEFLKSTLPLTHYYEYNGKVVKVPQAKWITQFLEDYRLICNMMY